MENSGKRYSFEGCVASCLFIILIAVIVLQISGRLSSFNPPIWTEELARWIWVWMAFIGIAEVERTNGHLRMEFIAELLGEKVKAVLYLIFDVIYLGVMIKLCQIAWKTVNRTWWNESVTLPLTDAAMYCGFFVASFFIIFRVAMRIFKDVKALRQPAVKTNEEEAAV
ncbi:TRAP transporter small permease [Rhodobacteraceae bacterium RKSG542]|uniref:TRAP transporter small permease n=1 Tax=Pseudovibrio flavus TaxID=2529854 RepID=UPI0012BD3311|nr:TRAP transporter small permease [Pseudovibrio flavus]MTI16463.1 TRAP transporter small permease [Pseudovibrio flavus]